MNRRSTQPPVREFKRFIDIVHRLRRECPWDREQTHESIRDMLIEEAYEVVETIDERDAEGLKKELGDILLHVAMHATIAGEKGTFTLGDLVREITEKLIRRHPHVFASKKVRNAREVKRNWEDLKMAEGRTSVLQGVPRGLPALQQAMRLQERAAGVGFDWEKIDDVWLKIEEELREFRQSMRSRSRVRREEELGDFLFSIVNYSRFLGINPESALRMTIRKFTTRFQSIEAELRRQGKDIRESSLEEMDKLWTQAKNKRKRRIPRR